MIFYNIFTRILSISYKGIGQGNYLLNNDNQNWGIYIYYGFNNFNYLFDRYGFSTLFQPNVSFTVKNSLYPITFLLNQGTSTLSSSYGIGSTMFCNQRSYALLYCEIGASKAFITWNS